MKKLSILIALALVFGACQSLPRVTEEEFAPDLRSPNVQIGSVEVQINRTFPMPGIRKINVDVFYFPAEDAVCLQWRVDMMSYYQFWSYDAREAFLTALERYKEDFEARSFGSNNRRAKRHYGTTKGYLIWQASRYSVQAKAPANIELGYYFVDRAPYFIANQREAVFESTRGRDENRTNPEMPIYFTRAQAEELAAFFDPSFLANITVGTPGRSLNVDIDEY